MERVYLDPTNQLYYIKKLKFFDTSFYITYDNNDNELTNTIDSPVYPYIRDDYSSTLFTNTNNQIFWIPARYDNRIAFGLY